MKGIKNLNSSEKDAAGERQELVAHYRLRGASIREITAQLAKAHPTIVNPRNGLPYSQHRIFKDLQEIKEEWKRRACESMDAHIARILAELAEVKREAWSRKDITRVIKAISQECRVLGIDSSNLKVSGDPANPLTSRLEVVFVGHQQDEDPPSTDTEEVLNEEG